MMVLVSYDVKTSIKGGKKRLRHVAKYCVDHGLRVQYSVFECDIEPAMWVKLRSKLIKVIDPKFDSLRFYFLGSNWKHKVEHIGAKKVVDLDEPLII